MQSQLGTTPAAVSAEAAVQNILSIINESLATSTSSEQGQGQSLGRRPGIQQEMARSFPGFCRRGNRGKAGFNRPAKVAKQWTTFSFTIFLVHKHVERTPTPVEDLQHMQAGLGKRMLSMPSDMNHAEVCSLFERAYPKLIPITGGWLLYKASGGNGRRNLSVVLPDSEGYTGSTIRCASGRGKTMIYILPLQEEFDLTPLPHDAEEFMQMKKAECKTCHKVMPLQLLALHVQDCEALSSSDPEITEVLSYKEKVSCFHIWGKNKNKLQTVFNLYWICMSFFILAKRGKVLNLHAVISSHGTGTSCEFLWGLEEYLLQKVLCPVWMAALSSQMSRIRRTCPVRRMS
ncbi:uncharacterized protein LOC117559802 isoform X3 [Gymnodraco acuticeps]|uniref:Uncharacterized protein LOC117559802 isoform X3 n=1 Tax=Gymnodraco acuticeps TaxID=8218 RepID=A0A6P8WXK5_GYMAC|nr:uncharacterized protein LOC117559802 isoform X3 [Gymnodraco acuticeps]